MMTPQLQISHCWSYFPAKTSPKAHTRGLEPSLRRHIVGRACLRGESLVGPELAGEAEVDDLQEVLLDGILDYYDIL